MRKFEYKKITIFGSETMPLEEAGAEGWLVASVHVENMASVYTMVREVAAPVETAQYSPEMAEASRIKKMLHHNQHIEIANVAAEHFFEKMESKLVIWEDDIAKYVKEELLADFAYPDWMLEKIVTETMNKLIKGSTLGAKQGMRKDIAEQVISSIDNSDTGTIPGSELSRLLKDEYGIVCRHNKYEVLRLIMEHERVLYDDNIDLYITVKPKKAKSAFGAHKPEMSDKMYRDMVNSTIEHFKRRMDEGITDPSSAIMEHLLNAHGVQKNNTRLAAYSQIKYALKKHSKKMEAKAEVGEPVKTHVTRKAITKIYNTIANDLVEKLREGDKTAFGVREALHHDPRVKPDEVEKIISDHILEHDDVLFDGTWFSHIERNPQKKHEPKPAKADGEIREFDTPVQIEMALVGKLKYEKVAMTGNELQKYLDGSIYDSLHLLDAFNAILKNKDVLSYPTTRETERVYVYVGE